MKNLVIAKIDGTANDWPPYLDVKGFPTIFFIPKDNKELPRLYNGERTREGIVAFLEENSSVLRAYNGVEEMDEEKTDDLEAADPKDEL